MDRIVVQTAFAGTITVGKLQAKYSANGLRVLRYFIDLWHKEMQIHKELGAPELYLLQGKVDELTAAWDKKYVEFRRRMAIASGRDVAEQLSAEASAKLASLSQILAHTLSVDDRVDWNALKSHRRFPDDPKFKETKPTLVSQPAPYYSAPTLSFWDKLFGRSKAKLAFAQQSYELAKQEWEATQRSAAVQHAMRLANWEARKATFEAEYAARKEAFEAEQRKQNARVDALALGISLGETDSVIEHASLVLENSDYGDLFGKSFEIDYVRDEKTLLVEYALPSPDLMPTLKTVKFVQSSGEIKETHISEREQKSNYDSVGYQICLRTIHELFEADETKNIEAILFNGFANYIDRSTGQDTHSCIMSVLVKRSDFEKIDLRRVDPKACFKSLKGVSASQLSALAPIPPVMELNKEDRRFIEAKSVAGNLDGTTNLAAMDWEDFEHLVRELFEKEFASRGGEVKITQASSDGGVDAVAFDPDPITGGKIVIQAKRYTKTVGVTAVRDLYGTMQHEGASRGILITTADYGPDAYGFASGKPITLFTGSNLLYLLEKHGYQAKIDIKEARKELHLRDHG